MKLHSEISVSVVVLLTALLISLSGGSLNKDSFRPSDNHAHKKNLSAADSMLIENYADYTKAVDSARTIILKWRPIQFN